jgi:TRAP-type C4-dicarboxylate transport system substrate-binding protein
MRALWDEKQAAARRTVLEAGVHFNQADTDAFHRAVGPMKQRWMRDETIAATVRRIDAHD